MMRYQSLVNNGFKRLYSTVNSTDFTKLLTEHNKLREAHLQLINNYNKLKNDVDNCVKYDDYIKNESINDKFDLLMSFGLIFTSISVIISYYNK